MNTKPFVVIGPSGSGKSTLINRLIEDVDGVLVKTVTTRPSRDKNDISHIFVDEETFRAKEDAGEFLGSSEVFGYLYGLPKLPETDKPVIVLLRAPFVETFKTKYPDAVVLQIEAPVETLLAHLETRGDVYRADATLLRAEVSTGRLLSSEIISNVGSIDDSYAQLLRIWQKHYGTN